MKRDYRNGTEARKSFEDTMSKLFRVSKTAVVEKAPKPKKASASKEK